MKKLVLMLGLLALVTPVMAYNEGRDGRNCLSEDSFCGFNDSQDKLKEALKLRNRYYLYRHRIRNRDHKTVYNEQFRHRVGKSLINVNEENTKAVREGALTDVPYYVKRRSANKGNYRVSNNSKQNWRRAAIGYYVDGTNGYTSEESMSQGVIKGSKHSVSNAAPIWQITKATPAADRENVRAMQKMEMAISDRKANKVATGKQKMTHRVGGTYQNFYSPYQNFGIYENPSYLRSLKAIMNSEQ